MSSFTEEYYNNTKNLKPSPLLLEALESLEAKGKIALDLGCGAGRDTKLLLEKGFRVTAVDNEPLTQKFIDSLHQLGNLTYTCSTFEGFDYNKYDLINARYSLPFNSAKSFSYVMSKIFGSLNPGGVFVGQLFGVNDEWNMAGSNMTFLERSEAKELFSSLDIIKFNEKDDEGLLANGSKKHWHVFDIIARQKKHI